MSREWSEPVAAALGDGVVGAEPPAAEEGEGAGLLERGPLRAMVAANASLTATVLPAFLTGSLGVQIGDNLRFGKASLGLAVAVFHLLSALGSLHAGELSDRIGPRRSLQIANVVSAACLLAVALFARSLEALIAILAVGSVGLTIAGPATKVLVAREVPTARHGVAFGIQMSAIPFGALLGGLAVPAIGLTLGWRWAFAGAVVIPLLGLATLPPVRRGERVARPSATRRFGHVDFGPLVVLGAAATLGSAAVTTTASFFVVTGTDAGFSEGTAGLLLSVASSMVIVLRIGFGSLADRYESGHPQAVSALFVLSTAGYACLATGAKALFPVGGFVALSFGWAWTGLLVFTVVRRYPHAPGLASSVIIGGFNLGSVLGPLLFGILIEQVANSTAFGITSGWTLLAALAAYTGSARLRRVAPVPMTPDLSTT